ncbi:hypothetical protein ACMD2_23972 [Ananas comosus]|uniref:HAT C-terminal dimerisation domain-containing protein n=1 Tax=Ananas comosus TaxID=4615 RepID=A0A199UDQ3_ANACO|nr:hypothetical protein ACMD2_23972 [Ananas comosus]
MSRDLHLAGYYLNPSYHYRYNLGFDDELLKALRNVINRFERDPTHTALAINEWWLQHGGSAKHLKKIVRHVLSQTTTSTYARLEKLVYIHYNMRLRLRCMQKEYDKEKELKTYDPLDISFIGDESDPIL